MGYGLVNAHAAVYAVAPRLTGPSTICSQATYTIQNLPQGATVQWSSSYSNAVALTSSGNTAVATANYCSNTYINILADVLITGGDTLHLSKRVLNGVPEHRVLITEWQSPFSPSYYQQNITYSLGSEAFETTTIGNYTYNNSIAYEFSSTAQYHWRVYGQTDWGGYVNDFLGVFDSNTMPDYTFSYPGVYDISVDIINSQCGHSRSFTKTIRVNSGYNKSYFSITPNPTSTIINISPSAESTAAVTAQSKAQPPTFDRVVISDAMGNVQLQQNVRATSTYRVDVSRLKNGIYYLNLYNAGKLIEKKTIQVAK